VRRTVRALRQFLESDPEPNLATRQHREALLDTLLDELVSLAAELQQQLPPGWSLDDDRFANLHRSEQLWLDPLRAELPDQAAFAQEWLQMDWPTDIGKRFANWLNAQLRDKLPLGDAEAREWAKVLLADEDGFQQQLRSLRDRLDGVTTEVAP
jgi:CRISPR-associated protein Csy1